MKVTSPKRRDQSPTMPTTKRRPKSRGSFHRVGLPGGVPKIGSSIQECRLGATGKINSSADSPGDVSKTDPSTEGCRLGTTGRNNSAQVETQDQILTHPIPLMSLRFSSPPWKSSGKTDERQGDKDHSTSQSHSRRPRNFPQHQVIRLRDKECIYRKTLSQSLSSYNASQVQLAVAYAKAVFKKTRTHAHLWFLSYCLRYKRVPKCFTIGFTPLTSSKDPYKGILKRTALDLLAASIRELRKDLLAQSSELKSRKLDLRILPDFKLLVIDKVRLFNEQYFRLLRLQKSGKLSQLGIETSTPKFQPTKVVCIPPDLLLSADERSILSKGLSFVPAPRSCNSYDILRDAQKMTRRFKLRYFFRDSANRERSIFESINPKTSNWTPYISHPVIQYFADRVPCVATTKRPNPSNLSREEVQAIASVRARSDIVIKPADKGGAVVVWRKDLYIEEALRQLSDTKHYSALSSDPLQEYQEEITATVMTLISRGELQDDASRLIVEDPKCSRFYLLPKIHKQNNPGRPIVSACACPTMHISAFVDHVLQPIVQTTPAFLKDTTDFLNTIKDIVYEDKFSLATGDVASLYTVIPHTDGLKALRHFLDQRSSKSPSTSCVLRLAELVLTLNAFEFNGDFYQQVSGVAMGTKMGPSYADLFMAYLEYHLFQRTQPPPSTVYKRFRDDIFIFSPNPPETLEPFLYTMNSMHTNISIEFKKGNSLPFLDTIVTASNKSLQTTVYYKPTDSHSYLLYSSYHPKTTREAIPYSQFLRLRRICSDEDDFKARGREMTAFFLGKLYPKNVIETAFKRASRVPRAQALLTNRAPTSEVIPFVITYSEAAKQTMSSVRKLFSDTIAPDEELGNLFPRPPIAAYRRPNSLRDILVKAQLSSLVPRIQHSAPGTVPCNVKKCLTCKHTTQIGEIVGPKGKRKIWDQFDCKSECLIYAILCAKCPAVYIGETKRKLHQRFREHLYNLSYGEPSEVTEHFTTTHTRQDMRVTAIQRAPTILERRREQEARIIHHLGTLAPQGLNTEFNFL